VKGAFGEASSVVKSCGKEASCYLDAATKAARQGDKQQFTGIKAAYMVGIYGNEKVRDQLVSGVDLRTKVRMGRVLGVRAAPDALLARAVASGTGELVLTLQPEPPPVSQKRAK